MVEGITLVSFVSEVALSLHVSVLHVDVEVVGFMWRRLHFFWEQKANTSGPVRPYYLSLEEFRA